MDAPRVVLHAGTDVATVRAAAESVSRSLSVQSVEGVATALDRLADGDVAALVCEASLADGTGLDLLAELHGRDPSLPSLFVTDDPALAEEAIATGATDVFVRREAVDESTLLGRRLDNVVPRSEPDAGNPTVSLLSELYDVTTDRDASFEEKVERLLALGCESFGLPYGFLTEIDPEDGDEGRQTIVTAQGDHELLQEGESCPLSEAYCRKTIETESLLAVANAEADGWAGDPAHETFGLGCYVGTKVLLDDDLYGTLCFASTEPRQGEFTDLERSAVRLMGEWVGYELQQRRDHDELRLKNRAMDRAPVGITIADATTEDLPLVYVNDEFERLTGYSREAVLGRNCRFLQGPDTDPEPVDEMREHIDTGEPVSVELRNYREDGTEFWNEVVLAPIEEREDGTPAKFVGFQRDVTERKQRELELRLRDRAMEEAPVGITIHDAAAAGAPITYVNEHFQSVTGYDAGALVGEGLSMLAGEDTDLDRFDPLDGAFESGHAATSVLVLERADGTPFWARVGIAPVTDEDGAVTHGVGFLQDVTDTKEHAETIERRLDEFGDLLAAELRAPLQESRTHLTDGPEGPTAGDIEAAVDAIERTDALIDDLTEVHSFSVKSREVFRTEGGDSP